MALKLKDDPVDSIQKSGSDYVNSDYSQMADDILRAEQEIPESRYSSSNTYQAMNDNITVMNEQFKMDKYNRQDSIVNEINRYNEGRVLPSLKWFSGNGGDNEITMYIAIVICAIGMILFFHRGMTSLRDMTRDTVEVEATITSVEHRERYVKRRKRVGRWVDEYRTTYEWVGENGEIQTNTRIYDERKFSEGDTAIVTVLANDLNQEIDSESTAKGKVVSSFFLCIGSAALLVVFVIRIKNM